MNDTEFQPKISFNFPNDNHAAFSRERLESILNQTYPYHEPIVLDAASPDTSVEVVHECLSGVNHQFILNKTNSGSTFLPWVRALAMAKGELIWITESNDVADPTLFEKLLQTFRDNDAALAYCQSIAINAQSEVTANLTGWEDVISRVSILHGRKIAYVAEALNRYRFHATTVRRLKSSVYLSECRAMTRWIIEKTEAWDNPGDLCDLRWSGFSGQPPSLTSEAGYRP